MQTNLFNEIFLIIFFLCVIFVTKKFNTILNIFSFNFPTKKRILYIAISYTYMCKYNVC